MGQQYQSCQTKYMTLISKAKNSIVVLCSAFANIAGLGWLKI